MATQDTGATSADDVPELAEEVAKTARDSLAFRIVLAVGLVAYGLIHLLIAWIALQLAWGQTPASADQQGALQQLASTPFGPVLLLATAIGLFALVFWRVGLAIWGFSWKQPRARRVASRIGSAVQALVYAALGAQALWIALGGGSGSGGSSEETLSARLLSQPFGRVLLLGVAAVTLGVGGYLIIKGIRKKFTEELTDDGTLLLNRIGQVGYVAKGLALALVGALFAWAAISHDAEKAGGIDAALHTIRDQPYGAIGLTVFAAGLAAFGLFCFGWSRRARRS